VAAVGRVVVAGAGIGGLTLARALLRQGADVTVLEAQPGLAEVGAGITLWRNALEGLEWLGLGEVLRPVAAEPGAPLLARSNGRRLALPSFDALPGRIPRPALLTFHRQDLQRVLYEALPPGVVRFGVPVSGFETTEAGVSALTSAGRVDADLLVGADGIGSAVRRRLLGDTPPRYAGYTCWRGVAPVDGRDVQPGELWGAGHRFGVVPIGGGRTYWFAVVNAAPRTRQPEPKAHLLSIFARYAFGVADLIRATPDAAIVHNDILDRPPRSGWSAGRVTLVGDAAHATTPNMGQGAAMAIESAVLLSRALARHDELAPALAAYERVRAPRTAWVTRSSWRIGRLAHARGRALRALRDLMLPLIPERLQLASLVRVLDYRASEAEV
jgi:2-polyprenyl-6-methoxyphenol hydroxylase-like FAD-dependent oxidoreductase